jgi:host factor-I protein
MSLRGAVPAGRKSWRCCTPQFPHNVLLRARFPSVRFVYNASMSFRGQQGNPNAKRGRTPPPEDTFEEASFLKALGEKQKSVSVKLIDGQIVRGWIEYYDRNMVRLTREDGPNLFIYKHEIMYIADDGGKKK